MDTYLSLHNFFLLTSFCFVLYPFSHLPSLFTLPGTIQLFNYFVHNFHYAGDTCPPNIFCILSLISFFFNVTDSLHYHGYRTLLLHFRSKQHLYKYFFWNKKKVKTHFLSSLTFHNNCLKSLSSLVGQQIFPRRSYVYFLTRLHSLIYCSNVNCQQMA